MSTESAIQSERGSMLAPTNIGEAIKLAEMMSGAKLVPMHLQDKPADCLLVIEQASRWQMSPFAVAQSTSVISGKLMYEGKLVAAVVNANGKLVERLSYEYAGTGDNRTITVSAKCRGEVEKRSITVRLGDAKTSNKMWQSQPDQQLMYHGARVWARRHMPELMLGVYSPEEMDVASMTDVTPPAAVDNVDPLTGEINKAKPFWKTATLRNQFTANLQNELKEAKTVQEINAIILMNKEKLDGMRDGDSRDELAVESINNTYKLILERLKKPAPTATSDVEDGALTPEEEERYATAQKEADERLEAFAERPPMLGMQY